MADDGIRAAHGVGVCATARECGRTADNRRRSAGAQPLDPPPPPPADPDFPGGKLKFTNGNIDLGQFWYTNFWVPDTPPLLTHA